METFALQETKYGLKLPGLPAHRYGAQSPKQTAHEHFFTSFCGWLILMLKTFITFIVCQHMYGNHWRMTFTCTPYQN